MAIWQFRVCLVPRRVASGFGASSRLTDEQVDSTEWWSDVQPPPEWRHVLDSVLPVAKSWSDEVLIWGDTEADDITVVLSGSRVESVEFRFDARRSRPDLLSAACEVARAWDCMLLTKHNALIEPEEDVLAIAFAQSQAARASSGIPRRRSGPFQSHRRHDVCSVGGGQTGRVQAWYRPGRATSGDSGREGGARFRALRFWARAPGRAPASALPSRQRGGDRPEA